LVLPCLASELERAALPNIVDQLTAIPYLNRIIIGLDRADLEGYRQAIQLFKRFPQPYQVIWNDGPRVQRLLNELHLAGISPKERGKGHNLWICFGLVQASPKGGVVVVHDCDISNYSSRLLSRLVYPVVDPRSNYVFAKGYYARVTDNKLYGRVSRLFVTPLLRALKRSLPQSRYLDYLDSFRYPLAGECAISESALRRLHITTDWGLEIGTLSEVFRDHSTRQLCQVDIADTYDHKHQPLGHETPHQGLNRMARDIASSIFEGLTAQGQVIDEGLIRTVVSAYQRIVRDLMDSYADVAAINGLEMDRGAELSAASTFAEALHEVGKEFVSSQSHQAPTLLWDEVLRTHPDILFRLEKAVKDDYEEYAQ